MKSTSLEAYKSILPELGQIHKDVLKALDFIENGSFRDISSASKKQHSLNTLSDSQVWKRLSELRDKGLIYESGIKICPVSGRHVTVWAIKQ